MRFIVGFFAFIGLLVVATVIAGGVFVYRAFTSEPELPDAIVLTFEFNRDLVEYPPEDPIATAFFPGPQRLGDVIDALDRAQADDRVKGLIARIDDSGLGIARIQEIRDAVARFRANGKFAYAYAETFGELGSGTSEYYLATAFERIWLQPVGVVGVTGIASEVPFARTALEKLGVLPQISKRAEYKTAPNSALETGFTPAHREMTEALLDDLHGQLVNGIAQARGLAPELVTAAIDRAPLLGEEALAAKLIDRLGYADELFEDAITGGAEKVELLDYLKAAGPPIRIVERRTDPAKPEKEAAIADTPTIALIHAIGAIQRSTKDKEPLLGEFGAGADTIVEAFEEASTDATVRAIVLRIDSPGGSAVASETIRRAVLRAREQKLPVIVSMGDVAASGGYWIAAPADKIVAQPATLTGSIGVFGGKVATEELWGKLGVNWGQVTRGAHSGMWSLSRPFTPDEQARVDAMLDDIYNGFTARVAEGRKLPEAAVRDIAKGRVWTGAQAKAIGLVDELGGLDTAMRLARTEADIPADAAVSLSVYPRRRSRLEQLLDFLGDQSSAAVRSAALTAAVADLLRPLAGQAAGLRRDQLVRMPDFGLVR